ncbi:MAG: hexitol phosphatase HxpB [Flavobacteriia bacterium]|nr:MAG: hexitol phosphatase HxpB [Flavobacteriia bacterium]
MKIKAVIYDMDGVLIDSEPLWIQSEIEIFAGLGIPLTHEMCAKHMGLRTEEVVELWYENMPWQGKSKEEVTHDILKRVTQLILTKGVPLEGVEDSIKHFKTLGLKVALASSSAKSLINAVLKKLNLTGVFEVANSAEHLEYGKPHPEIFIKTAKDLGVKPGECLVIEDSFNGVLAAKAAKMKVIAIPDKEHRNDKGFVIADHILNSLREIEIINIE